MDPFYGSNMVDQNNGQKFLHQRSTHLVTVDEQKNESGQTTLTQNSNLHLPQLAQQTSSSSRTGQANRNQIVRSHGLIQLTNSSTHALNNSKETIDSEAIVIKDGFTRSPDDFRSEKDFVRSSQRQKPCFNLVE